MQTASSRRQFAKLAAASVAAPFILPARLWSQSANGKIRMGFIGLGKQMGGLINKFLQYPDIEVVAVCDVYDVRRDLYKKKVDDHYAKKGGSAKPCETSHSVRSSPSAVTTKA